MLNREEILEIFKLFELETEKKRRAKLLLWLPPKRREMSISSIKADSISKIEGEEEYIARLE